MASSNLNAKYIIAVGSGKGGVGKSTVAVNFAYSLSKLGYKVGLMDADIYGPSVPTLVGSREEAAVGENEKANPPIVNGVKCMSMGFLASDGPLIWRGPIASRAIQQFLTDVNWGDLDYLVIDLPPGTGDIQLTLAQSLPITAAIIVTTPQKLAEGIAIKGLKMFQSLRIPVLGIVENMSSYVCESCHDSAPVFQSGAGERVAKAFDVPLLGEIPLDPKITREADEGHPVVLSLPDSKPAKAFLEVTERAIAELSSLVSGTRISKPQISKIEPNDVVGAFKLTWSDSHSSLVKYWDLRSLCPCAQCVDEMTGQRTLDTAKIPKDIKPSKVQPVGHYAIQIAWSDGHGSGIYSYDYLRKIFVTDKIPSNSSNLSL